jgi:hypothetical protein
MVAACGVDPMTKPRPKRLKHGSAMCRVPLQDLPLFVGWFPVLAKNLRRYLQLANVVKQQAPPQLLQLFTGNTEFGADQLAICPDPFDMAPGLSFVVPELHNQFNRLAGRNPDIIVECGGHLGLHTSCTANPKGKAKPRRRGVWEHQGQLQQCGQRRKAVGDLFCDRGGSDCHDDGLDHPAAESDPTFGLEEIRRSEPNGNPADEEWDNNKQNPDKGSSSSSAGPDLGIRLLT